MADAFQSYTVTPGHCARALQRASLPAARTFSRVRRGEVNAVFSVELVEGRQVVLKVQARGSRPERLLREKEACHLLRQTGSITVPTVLAIDAQEDILPFSYSILTHLPGLEGDAVWPSLSWDEQIEVSRSLGRTLAHIHAAPLTHRPAPKVLPVNRSPCDWVAEQHGRFEAAWRHHRACSYLPSWLLSQVSEFWKQRESLLSDTSTLCLLHGDYGLANVKLSRRASEVSGVFDLDQVDIGAPEFDLAVIQTSVVGRRHELREAFYNGYLRHCTLQAGFEERVTVYTLLRHLDMMLAYQGPVRQWDGTASDPETIARLVSDGCVHRSSTQDGVVRDGAVAAPGEVFDDPPEVAAVSGQYLAHVLSQGLQRHVRLTYWHSRTGDSWESFAGRGGNSLIWYQVAAEVEACPVRDLSIVLKVTSSFVEAMFYLRLARRVRPNVPLHYHVVTRPKNGQHWIFLELVPCMVLGPLWGGREFGKAVEGLVALHRRFWNRAAELKDQAWLPVVTLQSLLCQYHSQLAHLAESLKVGALPELPRRVLTDLLATAASSESAVRTLAGCLATQPVTLVHRDYHLANIGTHEITDEAAPIVGDWSSCACGPPQIDLAHFSNTVEGIPRKVPSREVIIGDYMARITAAGAAPHSREWFERGILAATFFDDIEMLSRLVQDWEGETSWRHSVYYSGEEEVAVRAQRCFRTLSSWPDI
ncbi:MAG: phosphotransferase [Armatimonadetes bacterium]|nr:phosphotransferase [Armatimonadota bacterium]